MVERLLIRALLVWASATLMGPLMLGCAGKAVRFYGAEPNHDGQKFSCDWAPDRESPFECVDIESYQQWQKQHSPQISL